MERTPYCSILGLFDGGNVGCNAGVRICRCKRANDCNPARLK
jgi:hypothetical protein